MWTSIALYASMLAVSAYSVASGLKKRGLESILRGFGFSKKVNFFKEFSYGLMFGAGMVVLSFAIMLAFVAAGGGADASAVSNIISQINFMEVLIVVIIGSIVEELFFRGYLQTKTNILFSSFIFAYYHIIYGSFSEIMVAFVMGMMLGYLFRMRKDLIAPITAHLFFNLVNLAIVFGV
ncbi:MAG: CPBP family intramembrane glutamic endopeptidase [Candidatus Micrarchaeota archaeon]